MGEWTPERIELVKNTVVPKGIPTDEFLLFMEQCKRSGLDPLLKEAFCVGRKFNGGTREHPNWQTRYEFQPSEAGMLARAESFPDFIGVQASEVYAGDEILVDQGRGEVVHRFNPASRKGAIIGAWARVARRDKLPVVVWLDFAGYAQESPLWRKIPGTMVCKCARVAALRKAYPQAFGGLYISEEMPPEEAEEVESRPALLVQTVPHRVDLPATRQQHEEAEVVGKVEATRRPVAHKAERVAKHVGGEVQAVKPHLPAAVAFGAWKGRPVTDLSEAELSAAMDFAHTKIQESPRAKWVKAMQENVAAIEEEVQRRLQSTPAGREPGQDDVPF